MTLPRCSTCDWWESEDLMVLNGVEYARCLRLRFSPENGEVERRTFAGDHCKDYVPVEDYRHEKTSISDNL